MKTKTVCSLLACIGLLSAFSSCGGTSKPTENNNNVTDTITNNATESQNTGSSGSFNGMDFIMPEGGFNTNKNVNIKFYTTMGDKLQKIFQAYLEDFNELYPNINVDTQFIGGYNDVRDQMSTELASGKTDVNVAYCYPDHVATYQSAKSVVCLDNLIEDDKVGFTSDQYKDFVKAYYNEGKSFGDGKMYCLPFSKSSEVMYYNKTFFDANNLQVPTHWYSESTLDTTSMEYVCKKIKELEPDSIPLGYDSGANWFITMTEQLDTAYTSSTGDHYLFDNDDNKAFVSKFKEWYDAGLVTTKDIANKYTSALFTETTGQRCFMCIGSSAGASYQDSDQFTVDIAPIPQANVNNPKVIQQGPDVCIFKNDDPQKVIASWLFVKYFTTNTEFQAEFSFQSGYTPILKSSFENEAYKKFLESGKNGGNIQALSTSVTVQQESAYFTSPAFAGSSKARTEVGNIITQVFSGKKDINTAFKDAVDACKA